VNQLGCAINRTRTFFWKYNLLVFTLILLPLSTFALCRGITDHVTATANSELGQISTRDQAQVQWVTGSKNEVLADLRIKGKRWEGGNISLCIPLQKTISGLLG